MQVNVFGWQTGQEDCLRLSVYSPPPAPPVQLPVIVWIHGGGFVSGQAGSSFAGPGFLLDQDVILVLCRVSLAHIVFPFFTDECPGDPALQAGAARVPQSGERGGAGCVARSAYLSTDPVCR